MEDNNCPLVAKTNRKDKIPCFGSSPLHSLCFWSPDHPIPVITSNTYSMTWFDTPTKKHGAPQLILQIVSLTIFWPFKMMFWTHKLNSFPYCTGFRISKYEKELKKNFKKKKSKDMGHSMNQYASPIIIQNSKNSTRLNYWHFELKNSQMRLLTGSDIINWDCKHRNTCMTNNSKTRWCNICFKYTGKKSLGQYKDGYWKFRVKNTCEESNAKQ